ncbi:MAG: TetR/AcrR family transcriptional regulator [Caldilineaceae bacterium]|nr:TetR/AcrR family transcriptional regulator [Caldilineaceae bacterium]
MSTSERKQPVLDPPTERGQRTRQKLLDAAEAVFGERFFENASITEITQRAGVAQGTFYVYFPDKKAVFVELVRDLSRNLRRSIALATAGIADRLEYERAGFRAFFDYIYRHRNLYRIVRQAEFVENELYHWYYRSWAESYVAGLQPAMEANQIQRMDPEVLAYCLMGIGDFLGMRWVLWNEEGLPDRVFEELMAFVERGMAPVTAGAARRQ